MNQPSNDYLKKLFNCHIDLINFIDKNRYRMGNTLLNVGLSQSIVDAGPGWVNWFTKEMKYPFEKLIILELNKDNVIYFKNKFVGNSSVEVIHGDVRTASNHIQSVDSVFWFHGPEHIKREELKVAFDQLNFITKNSMLWVCPWGNYYKLNIGDYEEDHHWYYPENEDFTSLGFDVFNDGDTKHKGNANINAYLFKK